MKMSLLSGPTPGSTSTPAIQVRRQAVSRRDIPRIARRFSACHYPHLFTGHISSPSGRTKNSPRGSTREALRACLGRQRRHSYQPRATSWVHRPETILSAESAIHCAEGTRWAPMPHRGLSRSGPMNPMRQAVGLQPNKTARKPRAVALGWYARVVG